MNADWEIAKIAGIEKQNLTMTAIPAILSASATCLFQSVPSAFISGEVLLFDYGDAAR
jgi:hypothetical protein